jgi:hypothetical protein
MIWTRLHGRSAQDVAHAVHHEHVEPRQLRHGVGPDVRPHQPAELLRGPGADADPVLEGGVVPLGRLFEAAAVEPEEPAVVGAADAVRLDHPVREGGAPVRARLLDDAVPAGRGLVDGEVLAEQAGVLDRELLELPSEGDRVPVAAQQLAHRRAGVEGGQLVVLLGGQHPSVSSSSWRCGRAPAGPGRGTLAPPRARVDDAVSRAA